MPSYHLTRTRRSRLLRNSKFSHLESFLPWEWEDLRLPAEQVSLKVSLEEVSLRRVESNTGSLLPPDESANGSFASLPSLLIASLAACLISLSRACLVQLFFLCLCSPRGLLVLPRCSPRRLLELPSSTLPVLAGFSGLQLGLQRAANKSKVAK